MSPSFLSSTAFFFIVILYLGLCHVSHGTQQATYIVHMGKSQMPLSFDHHSLWYDSSLRSVSESAEMLYTYKNAIHGFATRLTPQEANSLMTRPGVISVQPEQRYELHTTRTPLFLGLDVHNSGLFPETGPSSNVVVGVLDTGVWPESKSFSDAGYGPIPPTWKGGCDPGTRFTASLCNRKLIGARFFVRGYEAINGPVDESKESKSPRDDEGHGTHTASTAAGSIVEGANLLGFANGTARGIGYGARVAAYKVCWRTGCFTSDILAGIDKAIEDNVNVLSISLSGRRTGYTDDVAIGAFAAMEKGIFVSCSAGNNGPFPSSVANVAPWITTVGAGTLDRDFPALAILGNGKKYTGVSLFRGDALPPKMLPFVYAGNASNNATYGKYCFPGTLIPDKVKGKIVMCEKGRSANVEKGEVVKAAGGLGMILPNTAFDGEELLADAFMLLATTVGKKAGDIIRHYTLTDPNPTASIVIQGTVVNVQPSPVLAAFSSRGPNPITPNILKPDLIAPGVNILAAWTGAVGPSGLDSDTRRVEFNIISGTSMSCPHVSGLAALLKSVHPEWSPAAIRSALMTTAYNTYKDGKPILDVLTLKPSTPFGHGAGHVSPATAVSPGLIYDLTRVDYIGFLCAMNYNSSLIKIISRGNYACDASKTYSVADLNYPSFAVNVNGSDTYKYTRTVTNVGGAGSYSVKVTSETTAVKISVEPAVLNFEEVNEKKSYAVTFTVDSSKPSESNSFGSIEWSDGKHVVASPVAISWT
ncbi:Subtilisin-like protease SBT1.7 [Raphanus sativus]|uniref:Subtilisin-like protease SBT1.7 n=1 Tax=Raphanus sativus TaxID=3726 RepID=A0A6J0KZB7_RAPSA|nr:subtilisin-like protease SBT1.7 [Raphanus sativus]KAJ4878664.1 Subtilisin-like protease SBT1.7 [Raphanus sativus]